MTPLTKRVIRLLLAALAGLGPLVGAAQALRDPTVPPVTDSGSSSRAVGGVATAPDSDAFTIIVRDGKPGLVVGTRVYTQGQTLGSAKIERITETEVWLREGKVLKKLSQFAGIERRAAQAPGLPSGEPRCKDSKATAPVPSKLARSNASKTVPGHVACADDQP